MAFLLIAFLAEILEIPVDFKLKSLNRFAEFKCSASPSDRIAFTFCVVVIKRNGANPIRCFRTKATQLAELVMVNPYVIGSIAPSIFGRSAFHWFISE